MSGRQHFAAFHGGENFPRKKYVHVPFATQTSPTSDGRQTGYQHWCSPTGEQTYMVVFCIRLASFPVHTDREGSNMWPTTHCCSHHRPILQTHMMYTYSWTYPIPCVHSCFYPILYYIPGPVPYPPGPSPSCTIYYILLVPSHTIYSWSPSHTIYSWSHPIFSLSFLNLASFLAQPPGTLLLGRLQSLQQFFLLPEEDQE